MAINQKKKHYTEENWIENIQKGDERAFEQLFFTYFYDLTSYAFQITNSTPHAKDIVQEVFYKLWKRRKQWKVHSSLKAYLFRSVRNEALNQLDRDQLRKDTREELKIYAEDRRVGQFNKNYKEDQKLIKQIWEAVLELPERRQSVFILHRKHGLSYKEISQVMGISRKTVENHMGLALDDIRNKIGHEH